MLGCSLMVLLEAEAAAPPVELEDVGEALTEPAIWVKWVLQYDDEIPIYP